MIRSLTVQELHQYLPRLHDAEDQLAKGRPMNTQRFVEKWEQWYALGIGTVLGYWHQGQLGATLGAIVSPDLYDDQPTALELFFNVRPEARGTIGWRGLLPAYRAWATAKGATTLYLSRWASCPRLGDLYRKLGFEESEIYYRARIGG